MEDPNKEKDILNKCVCGYIELYVVLSEVAYMSTLYIINDADLKLEKAGRDENTCFIYNI